MSEMTPDRLRELAEIAEALTWMGNKVTEALHALGSENNPKKALDILYAAYRQYHDEWKQQYEALLDEIERLRRELDGERGGGGSESHTTRYLLHCSEYGTWKCEADDCDALWYLEDGTPSENRMRYCPGCGRRIVAEVWDMEEQEAEEESA